MRGVLSGLLVLMALLAIYRFMIGGRQGRVGRPPKGVLTRWASPAEAVVPTAAMAGYALGRAVDLTAPHSSAQNGLIVGGIVGFALAFHGLVEKLVIAALGVVAALCACIDIWAGVNDASFGPWSQTFRAALFLLLFACFILGSVVGDRSSALKGERGFALIGLVDIVVFLARPVGIDPLNVQGGRGLAVIGVSCLVAAVAGFAVSEAVLGLIALGVFGLTIIAGGPDGWSAVVAGISAVGFAIVIRQFTVRAGV
jgi:hypothetical protein